MLLIFYQNKFKKKIFVHIFREFKKVDLDILLIKED